MKRLILLYSFLSVLYCNSQTYNYQIAMEAYDAENYEKAIDYLSRDLNDNPKNAKSYYYRANLYNYYDNNSYALSDINNSIKNFNSKEKEYLSNAYQLRGDIYLKLDNYEKTIDDYSIAIKFTPNNIDLLLDRAQIYFTKKDFNKAEIDYRQVIKIDESEVRGWAGLGRNLMFQENYTEAEKILTKLIKLNNEYPTAYHYRSLVYYRQNKFDEAINDIFYCYLLDESDDSILKLFISFSSKNHPLSLAKVKSMINSKSENATWHYISGRVNESSKNYAAAINDFSKAIDLANEDNKSLFLYYRAECYKVAGNYDKAISDYNELITRDPKDAYYYGYRGNINRLKGNYKVAVADLTKAIELEGTESWFYYIRGWIKDEFMNEYNDGLSDYNYSISLDKSYAYTYLHRGRLFESKLNNPVKAKEDFQMIINLENDFSQTGNCRQYALFHLGRNDEAIKWMNDILEQYPSGDNYYEAVCLFSLMNNPKESIENLKKAFQNGYVDFKHLTTDNDLDNVRNLNEYKTLVLEWENKLEQSLKSEYIDKVVDFEYETETVSIPMISKKSGVYEIPCKVNDLKLNMIFDTGASDISISQTEVQFMLKNGYLNNGDFMGSQRYMDANGNVEVGTKVNFKNLEFGGLALTNVSATVVHNKNAPLLFGQSALSKYGKIVIDNEKKLIIISNTTKKVKP